MSIDVSPEEDAARDMMIEWLRSHDVRYLVQRNVPSLSSPAPSIDVLAQALIHSSDARLRTALVGLLLRHPDYAADVRRARGQELEAGHLDHAQLIAVSIVVAAALQHRWAFSLDLYLPGWMPIEAEDLVTELCVISPRADYGRGTLDALDSLLQAPEPVAVDYRGAWENVAEHILEGLREELYTSRAA